MRRALQALQSCLRSNAGAISVGAVFLLLLSLHVSVPLGAPTSIDLPSFYLAGIAAKSGQSPYDDDLRDELARGLGRRVFPFLSPPAAAPLFIPFTWLEFESAARAILIVNLVAALFILHLLLGGIGLEPHERLARFAVVLLWVGGVPLQSVLEHGQIDLLVLALIACAWQDERGGIRPWRSGMAIGLAIALKQSPVVLLSLLIARRRWASITAAVGTFVALSLVASLCLPDGVWSDWTRRIAPTLSYGETPHGLIYPATIYNQSFNGTLARLLSESPVARPLVEAPELIRPLGFLLAGAVLSATFAVARLKSRGGCEPELKTDLSFSVALGAAYLVAPLSWEHHLVFLSFSLATAWRLARGTTGGRLVRLVLVSATALVTLPLPLDRIDPKSWFAPILLSARCWGVLAIWICLLWFATAPSIRSDERIVLGRTG